MSSVAWCDLNSNNNFLRLPDLCSKPLCKCKKETAFTPKQVQKEGDGFKYTMTKIFKGSQKAWNSFLKLTVNTLAPVIGLAIGAKSNNTQVGQANTNILRNISGENTLSLTDMHGQGLRLK